MDVQIKRLLKTFLAGRSLEMSIGNDCTRELWSSFRPLVPKIGQRKGAEYFNVQIYSEDFHQNGIDPNKPFEKWAAVAIEEAGDLPEGIKLLTLPEGLYAVFEHIGPASSFPLTMNYIYAEWLPKSDYRLDHRAHFEILPEDYRPDDPEAREEVWIPIRPK